MRRNSTTDLEKRIYPGGFFDPLNFADESNPERAFSLKTAEIKHGRLAMVAALGARQHASSLGAWPAPNSFGETRAPVCCSCGSVPRAASRWEPADAWPVPSSTRARQTHHSPPCRSHPRRHPPGFAVQAGFQNEGALGSLRKFGESF